MISSTITELLAPRAAIEERLRDGALADGWLFELHAAAAGAPAEDRYLGIARSCDLYVIVVAAQGSEATEAEYRAAFDDNPRKVLAFYLGRSTPETSNLRSLIDSRHSRVSCATETELVDAVVAAIEDSVRTGEIVRPSLVADLDGRLRRAEVVVSRDLPLSFIPHVRAVVAPEAPTNRPPLPVAAALDAERRLVLEGIGGSGKTYASLAAARWSAGHGRLPLVISPRANQLDVARLVAAAFDSVGFFPGDDLQQELARDGRLVIVADGVDAVASDERRIFLESLDTFARTSPRCQVVCCVRRSLPNELPTFVRFSLEPLTEDQTRSMFEALHAPQIRKFPRQVADLARWPLWAWALTDVGPHAETGLVLLQRLIEHRIAVSGSYGPIEAELLHGAAAALAYAAWPQPLISASDALTTLAAWADKETTKRRYDPPSASTIIERLSGAGILQQGEELGLAHPLFATYLAARQATADEMSTAMRADPEFAMFVAALLPRDRESERLELLAAHGAIGQARFLRLVPPTEREPKPTDPQQFGAAVEQLSGTAAECIVTERWTAWREADSTAAAGEASLDDWLSERKEIVFIEGNAFRTRSTGELASLEALSRYKTAVRRLEPDEKPWHDGIPKSLRQELRKLSRDELDERLIQAAIDWRRHWRDLASALGVDTLPEAQQPDGDPAITVVLDWSNPRFSITWVRTAKVTRVNVDAETKWRMRPLGHLLQPEVETYRELVGLTEKALGCMFGSQAWSRPEQVAAWAW